METNDKARNNKALFNDRRKIHKRGTRRVATCSNKAQCTTHYLLTAYACSVPTKKSVHVSIATFNNPDNKNTQNHSALNVMNEGKTNRKKESYTYTHTLLYRFDI